MITVSNLALVMFFKTQKSESNLSFHLMVIKFSLALLVFSGSLFAKNVPYEERIIRENSPLSTIIVKKMLVLPKEEVSAISKRVKLRLNKSVYRTYIAYKDNEVEHYAIILSRVIRTKKATVLYIIDKNDAISSIEILSFKEPREYKPNQAWQNSLVGKTINNDVKAGVDIPTISGATMSASSITDGARLALALIQKIK